jgi:hypothetical protein
LIGIILLFSPIIASADVIVPNPISEPGFETVTGWAYAESDANNCLSGGQTTLWKTQGSYSYELKYIMNSCYITAGQYVQVSRLVNFTNIRKITWDSQTGYNPLMNAHIYIDSTEISSGQDLFSLGLSNSHTLKIQYYVDGTGSMSSGYNYPSGTFSIDNLISYNNSAPSIPIITNPTNNSINYTTTTVNMTWNASIDPEGDTIGYTYQIANNSAFTDLIYYDNVSTLYSGDKSIPANQQIFFRVKANDTNRSSPWSPTVSIRDVTLSTPSNGSTQNFNYPPLTDDVYFSWIATNSSTVNFNLLVAQDSAFYLVVYDSTFNGLSKTLSLSNGTYYWKVRPYYTETSTYGAFTPAWIFSLNANYNPSGRTGIAGTVYHIVDGTQVPLSDAIVYIHNEVLNWSSNQITGANGYYLFDNLTNNTVYSVYAKATGYEDSVTEYVTTAPAQRTIKNILLTKCISGFNCGFYTQPVTFTLRNLFDASFPGVTATVYKGDELTATDSGITDSSGSVTFMLNKDQKYRVVFSGGGMDTLTFYAFGSSTNYRILVVSGFPTGGNRNEDISANLTVTTINATHSNLSLIYKDNRSSTTAINFYATNLTTGQTCTQTSTSQDTTLSCAVLASGTYRFGFNATSSIFGFFQQDKTINFGAGTQANNPLAGRIDSTLLQWGCIMLLVFVAAMFSVQTVKFGAVIVPAMAMVFWSLGWMQVNFILVATAMCIGVMVYLRSSEHKVEY